MPTYLNECKCVTHTHKKKHDFFLTIIYIFLYNLHYVAKVEIFFLWKLAHHLEMILKLIHTNQVVMLKMYRLILDSVLAVWPSGHIARYQHWGGQTSVSRRLLFTIIIIS